MEPNVDDRGGWSTRNRWILAAILLASLAVRLFWAYRGSGQPLFGDGVLYDHFARGFLDGNYPEDASNFRAMLPPGYPAFVAGSYLLFGRSNHLAVFVLQCLMSVASLYLVAVIGRRLYGQRVGVAAAAVMGVYPYGIFYPATLMTETLYLLLNLANVLVLVAYDQRPSHGKAVGAGALAGLAALTRPQHMLVAMVMAAWVATRARPSGGGAARRLVPAVLLVATCFAVIAPWTIRNYFKYRELVLVTDNGTDVLWWGNNPINSRMYLTDDPAEFKKLSRQIWGPEGERVLRRGNRTLAQKSADVRAEVFRYIRENPGEWLRIEGMKLVAFWRPWLGGTNSASQSAISIVTYGPLLLLGLPFLVIESRRRTSRTPVARLVLATFTVHTLIALVFVALSRYRFPAIDPFLAVFACAALTEGIARLKARQTLRRVRDLPAGAGA